MESKRMGSNALAKKMFFVLFWNYYRSNVMLAFRTIDLHGTLYHCCSVASHRAGELYMRAG